MMNVFRKRKLEPFVPPITEAERAWWRSEKRGIIWRAALKLAAFVGAGALGIWLSGRPPDWWLDPTRHLPTWLFIVSVVGTTDVLWIHISLNADRAFIQKRAADREELRKRQFLDALDTPNLPDPRHPRSAGQSP